MDFQRSTLSIVQTSTTVLLLFCAGLGVAREPSGHEIADFSLTPFGGYTFGGEFEDAAGSLVVEVDDSPHYGLIVNRRESANTQWELFYSRQQSEADTSALPAGTSGRSSIDLDVQYLHLGGTYVGDGARARPFLAATLGGTRFDPDPLSFDSENFFSFSIGAGYQLQPTERLGLRLGGRLFGTLLRSDTDLFCQTGPAENVCAISADSDIYWQFQTSLGVVFRF